MTALSSIRLLIGVDLGQKGLPSSIITPILTILDLADEEMRTVGYDFEDPRIADATEDLERAIAEMNGSMIAFDIESTNSATLPTSDAFGNNLSPLDPLSYLDDDDGN